MKMKPIFKNILLAVLMLFSIESIAQVNQWRDIYEAKKKNRAMAFFIARTCSLCGDCSFSNDSDDQL